MFVNSIAALKAPHLKILFQELRKEEGRKVPYLDVLNIWEGDIPIRKEIYCRPYIRNLGLNEAQHCEMKVKIWEEGKTSPVDYQPLHWASNVPGVIAQTVSEAYKKIEIGFEERIDLLRAFYDFNSELHIKNILV